MKRMCLGILLSALLLVPAVAGEPVAAVESVKPDMDQGLGLTAEQKERIRAVRQDYKTRQHEVKKALNARLEALRVELDGDKPVRDKVDLLAAEIKKLQSQLIDNRIDVVFKLRGVYTPAQLMKLKQRMKYVAENSGKAARPQSKKARKLQMKKTTVKKK